jgi:hypothetical protein
LVRDTKTGKNVPNKHKMSQMVIKYSKWPKNTPHGHKIDQHYPILDPPKVIPIGIFGLKLNRLATLVT